LNSKFSETKLNPTPLKLRVSRDEGSGETKVDFQFESKSDLASKISKMLNIKEYQANQESKRNSKKAQYPNQNQNFRDVDDNLP